MPILERTLRLIVLAGIFALPFVPLIVADGVHFFYNLFFPYITGKNFAFRIIVEIMAGAYLALALVSVQYRPKRSWVLGALALFVVIVALADIFGQYPMKSIWSNFERMDGLVTLVHLLLYTSIASIMLTTEKMWRWLFWVSLGVSVYLAIYGLLQVAGFSTIAGGATGSLTSRIDATFGNPIYLAVYMLFHVFIAALLWAQQWVERRPGDRLSISILYGAIMVLDTMVLLFTSTRGTILGLGGGVLLTAILVVFQANRSRVAWRVAIGALVTVVVVAGGIFLMRDTLATSKVGFLQRLGSITLQETTVKARFYNWSMAWEGVKERPILGWGQENYALVFDKFYDPRMYGQESWFDRVHNVVFDWLVAAGFLGLFSYLAIFGAALYLLWTRGFSIAERSILTGLLAAYFCHNFFVFDNVTSYILFGTVLAYIVFRSSTAAKRVVERRFVSENALPYAALGALLLTVVVVPAVNAKPLTANMHILSAIAAQQGGALKNLEYFESAIALGTFGTQEAREQLAQIASQVAASDSFSLDIKQKFLVSAVNNMRAQEEESASARFPLFLGVLYEVAGETASAGAAFERAHNLSPRKQQIYFKMAENAMNRGDEARALAFYKTAYELDTSFTEPRFRYAAALIRAGSLTEADALIAPYIASGVAADPHILAAYVDSREYIRAAPLWQAKISAQPLDAQAYFTLAAIYYQAGDRPRAIETLQQAKQAIPSLGAQVDALIHQVLTGTVPM